MQKHIPLITMILIGFFFLAIACSKSSTESEPTGQTTDPTIDGFQVAVRDMNGDPYTCGFIQLTYEENSTLSKGSQGGSAITVMQALNTQGVCRFTFGEEMSVLVKRYQILDYLFEEISQKDLDISVPAGDLIKESFSLNLHENVDVYWERLNFSKDYDLSGKRILTVVGDDYDLLECRMIIEYLAYFGADIVVASNRLDVSSHYWLRIEGRYQSFPGADSVEVLLQNLNFDDFDCLFFPGGNGPANLLHEYPEISTRIYQAWSSDTLFFSAICHGPLLLAESGIISGKEITGHPDIKNIVLENGGIFIASVSVLVDGNIQTGNWPHFNPFAQRMAQIMENW